MNPAPLPELDIIEQDEDVDITHQTKVASKGQEIGLHGSDAVHLRLPIGCALREQATYGTPHPAVAALTR